MTIYTLWTILSLCFFGIITCIYMLIRNEWVYNRRVEIIDTHFNSEDWRTNLDKKYGSYQDWMYKHPFCWNSAKMIRKFNDKVD